VSNQQVVLSWTISPAATGYDLKRSTDGGTYLLIATNLGVATYTDANVVDGPTYYYEVSSVNGLGESPDSAPITANLALPPTQIPAANDCGVSSGIQFESCSEGGQDMGYINSGAWAKYCSMNFGPGTLGLNARVASGASGGNIELRLGTTNGPVIGLLTVPGTGGWQTWTTVSTALTNAAGAQTLVLWFVGGGGYLLNVEWLEFTPISTLPVPLGWQRNGQQFQFNWPADHIGWRLQVQTNAARAGLGTNWVMLPGSTGTNVISIPLGQANSSVFFRLVSP
jgi:hypothetical protein